MIIGEHRDQVIQNIEDAVRDGDYYRTVEVDDPVLTRDERYALLAKRKDQMDSFGFTYYNRAARSCVWILSRWLNWDSKFLGLENLDNVHGGAIITSNHFSPLDNFIVRRMVGRAFHQRLFVVSKDSNLAMKGFTGFLMNFTDIIPISDDLKYMSDYFNPSLKDVLAMDNKVLIYPEQEMWFNYRKPRPPKRGAYYYAATNFVPVISCFVEMQTLPKKEKQEEFYKTRFVMHILPTIFPDPDKSVRENSRMMMEKDYQQKKQAYEEAYGRPLTYEFEKGDIAGWVPGEREVL